jgi:hypothetical protein
MHSNALDNGKDSDGFKAYWLHLSMTSLEISNQNRRTLLKANEKKHLQIRVVPRTLDDLWLYTQDQVVTEILTIQISMYCKLVS